MTTAKHVQILIVICLVVVTMAHNAKAIAGDRLTNQAVDNTEIAQEPNQLNNSTNLAAKDQLLDTSKTRFGVGFGYANAIVLPNTDNKFNDGRKLSLGFGLSTEIALAPYFALTARADLIISSGYTVFAGADASLSATATAGFIIGKVRQPGQFYLTATAGPGAAIIGDRGLDDEGKQDCILCTSKQGGTSAGLATRLAIGRTGKLGQRIELVYMRTGGNGNNRKLNQKSIYKGFFIV